MHHAAELAAVELCYRRSRPIVWHVATLGSDFAHLQGLAPSDGVFSLVVEAEKGPTQPLCAAAAEDTNCRAT